MELKLESRIDGTFEGWDGDSVYKLINGHVYKQRRYKYKYKYKYRPKVKIWKTNRGLEMEVEGLEFTVPVERID